MIAASLTQPLAQNDTGLVFDADHGPLERIAFPTLGEQKGLGASLATVQRIIDTEKSYGTCTDPRFHNEMIRIISNLTPEQIASDRISDDTIKGVLTRIASEAYGHHNKVVKAALEGFIENAPDELARTAMMSTASAIIGNTHSDVPHFMFQEPEAFAEFMLSTLKRRFSSDEQAKIAILSCLKKHDIPLKESQQEDILRFSNSELLQGVAFDVLARFSSINSVIAAQNIIDHDSLASNPSREAKVVELLLRLGHYADAFPYLEEISGRKSNITEMIPTLLHSRNPLCVAMGVRLHHASYPPTYRLSESWLLRGLLKPKLDADHATQYDVAAVLRYELKDALSHECLEMGGKALKDIEECTAKPQK